MENSKPYNIQQILQVLQGKRFSLEDEKVLQYQIQERVNERRIVHGREYFLGEGSEIDFLIDGGIGIEVKIKGNAKKIYEQCKRYSMYDEIKGIILVTNKVIGTPPLFYNKPFVVCTITENKSSCI